MRADIRSRRRRTAGLTLIELMVALSVLGALLVIGLPSFTEVILGNRLTAFANSFVSAVQLGRSEAIKRNARVKLCVANAGGTGCTTGGWQQGWILFRDADDDDTVDSDEEVVLRQTALGGGFSLTDTNVSPVTQLIFQSGGEIDVSRDFRLCRASPSPGGQERTIRIMVTGRVSGVVTSKDGTCP